MNKFRWYPGAWMVFHSAPSHQTHAERLYCPFWEAQSTKRGTRYTPRQWVLHNYYKVPLRCISAQNVAWVPPAVGVYLIYVSLFAIKGSTALHNYTTYAKDKDYILSLCASARSLLIVVKICLRHTVMVGLRVNPHHLGSAYTHF